MKVGKWQWPSNSLRMKLSVSVIIMTLPLVGMLLYNNFYAISVVRAQVADSYKNTLSFYMNQIDADLNDVDSYMNTVASSGSDLLPLGLMAEDADYIISKVYLFNKLSRDIALYPSLNAFFVYVEPRQDYIEVFNREVSFQEKERIQQYIIELIHQRQVPRGTGFKRWQYAQIGNDYYLINIVKAGNAYLGAWIKTDRIVQPLQSINLGEGGLPLLTNDLGEPITSTSLVQKHEIELRTDQNNYYLSGTEKKFLIVGQRSNRGDFSLYALIPDESILDNLPYLQKLVWMVTIAAIFFIPIGLYMIRQVILVPLGRVLIAMKKVRSGDWGVRVRTLKGSDEFILLGNSFNSMMSEIQTLRINVFEEQLNKQREELQRLQLQVNPHFFLNSLNIVYNLAKVKNFNLIMEMTMALIQYFRFLFRSNTAFVKLKEELEHTRNYLSIQTLRFPDKLTWSVDAPDYLTDVPVPPLIIQSFVENSIKHAVTMEEAIHISVQISFADEESGSIMNIRIQDTGKGFSDEVLQELQAGRSVENDLGERTGIWNVQRRLRLLYGETASISYFNNELDKGGAVVDLCLPIKPGMEEKA